ncbi:glutamate receptor ionotropic, kainate 4-like, partial [Poeciliopsis prolifica]|uniref:glutamate receptor ionotropic, kainate 4-like n=1 Tax=Poeciliopsis prolifica TaxID=188132 RepID=UPI0024140486
MAVRAGCSSIPPHTQRLHYVLMGRGLKPIVPYVKVAPEDILKVQFPRFTTLDLRPTNTDISLAVAGLLTFFNSTASCLICAQADCLLNLEQLLRQFLISKETLSVRMLDDSQDPTPLLKEIRDDKTATIIVDANATMSHIILER